MSIKRLFKSMYKIYQCSQKSIHILVVFLTIILCFLVKNYGGILTGETETNILTGISIMSSFFLLTLQTMKFGVLNEYFNEKKAVLDLLFWRGEKIYEESVIIRNTIFSLSINIMFLVGVCFILALFSVNYLNILIFLIVYLFIGIIYTLVLWNYFSYKEK